LSSPIILFFLKKNQLFPGCCSKIPAQVPEGYVFAQDDVIQQSSESTHIYSLSGAYSKGNNTNTNKQIKPLYIYKIFTFFIFIAAFTGATTRGIGFGRSNRLLSASISMIRLADGSSGTTWASGLTDAYGLVVLPTPTQMLVFVSDTGTGIIKRYVDGGGSASSVSDFATGLTDVRGIVLSPDYSRLYAVHQGANAQTGLVKAFNVATGALISTLTITDANSVRLNNIVFSPHQSRHLLRQQLQGQLHRHHFHL
jgi:hypothetical protein